MKEERREGRKGDKGNRKKGREWKGTNQAVKNENITIGGTSPNSIMLFDESHSSEVDLMLDLYPTIDINARQGIGRNSE